MKSKKVLEVRRRAEQSLGQLSSNQLLKGLQDVEILRDDP